MHTPTHASAHNYATLHAQHPSSHLAGMPPRCASQQRRCTGRIPGTNLRPTRLCTCTCSSPAHRQQPGEGGASARVRTTALLCVNQTHIRAHICTRPRLYTHTHARTSLHAPPLRQTHASSWQRSSSHGIAQSRPFHAPSHRHVYEPSPGTHVPPFWHGDAAHGEVDV